MKRLIGVLGLISLTLFAGCEQKSYGPAFETTCKFEEPISINIAVYDSESAIRRYWESVNPGQTLPPGAEVKGLATYNTRTKVHTIHLMPIRGQNDHDRVETLGHEILHSYCGDWHPRLTF